MQNNLSQKIAWALWVYIKTQCLVIAIVTLVSWGVLSMLGVEYPLLLGILTGSASVVPILGLVTTAIIAALVAIFDSTRFLPTIPTVFEGLIVLFLYGVLNVVVDYFLSPYLIGKTTKVHPLLLLVSILVGTFTFGFIGAFLAVPTVLIVKTILDN